MNPEDILDQLIKKYGAVPNYIIDETDKPKSVKKKVFCENCEWFRRVIKTNNSFGMGNEYTDLKCLAPTNIKVKSTPIIKGHISDRMNPADKNIRNDCNEYSEAKYHEIKDEIDIYNFFYDGV